MMEARFLDIKIFGFFMNIKVLLLMTVLLAVNTLVTKFLSLKRLMRKNSNVLAALIAFAKSSQFYVLALRKIKTKIDLIVEIRKYKITDFLIDSQLNSGYRKSKIKLAVR